jgi:hypothetical protein
MKNFQLEIAGMQELEIEEQREVSGGIGLILLAAMGGIVTIYNIGKIVGAELYRETH